MVLYYIAWLVHQSHRLEYQYGRAILDITLHLYICTLAYVHNHHHHPSNSSHKPRLSNDHQADQRIVPDD